ncbi:MAG: beta-galactosidase [Bryobacteraceae bacterium]
MMFEARDAGGAGSDDDGRPGIWFPLTGRAASENAAALSPRFPKKFRRVGLAMFVNVFSILSTLVIMAPMGASQSRAEIGRGEAQKSFYPLAVWYGGGKARAPMLERIDASSAARWGTDLDQIRSLGFSTIKTWVDWATAESARGQFSFANLDLLLQLANARGMRVIVQIYLDSAPDWVGQLYPNGRFVDRSGAVITSQSAPGYCIDHTGVRKEIIAFLEALSREANRSPALYGWDVWSEPHVINWAEFPYLAHPEFCFCSYSQTRFREWLKARYKTLDALNAAWYRKFENWTQIEPPRYPTILSYTDYIDWRTFIDDKLAGDLKTRVNAIRTADKTHPITSHAAVPGLFTSPTDGYGEPDDWKMSANADFFGTSLYPKHSESAHPWSYQMMAAGLDFSRSAGRSFGKGFWIGELQAGQGATGMAIADPVTAHDEEFWIWQVIAHGARELAIYAWYPMSSGFESNGYGLINLDGTITDRARAAGNIARAIERRSSDLLNANPAPAEVAILYNRLSYMVGGSQPSLSKLGNAERDSLIGLHRAFFEQQIPVDFVHPQDVAQDKLGQYKILFLPFPVMLSKDVADGIKRYVQNGGTAVGEARLAWNNERGFASEIIPGFGLYEIFGSKEKLIRPAKNPRITIEGLADLPGLNASQIISGDAFEEHLDPLSGARVLGRFAGGAPAIVENSFGKGRAILLGSFVALAYHKQPSDSNKAFFLSLAQAAGVSSDVEVTGPQTSEVEVRRLVKNDEQIVFAFNHSKNSADANLSVKAPWNVRQARNLSDDIPVPFQMRNRSVLLHKNFAAGEIWVFTLEGPH